MQHYIKLAFGPLEKVGSGIFPLLLAYIYSYNIVMCVILCIRAKFQEN